MTYSEKNLPLFLEAVLWRKSIEIWVANGRKCNTVLDIFLPEFS